MFVGMFKAHPIAINSGEQNKYSQESKPQKHVCAQPKYGAAAADRGWAGDVVGLFNSILSHTCVVPWKNGVGHSCVGQNWVSHSEGYSSHMFVCCGVHVAREGGIPLELPAVFSCQMSKADFSVLVPSCSQLSFPLTCLSPHRYWHYHEGCGAVTTEGLRVLDGETSLLLPAHN